jgi:hypothetical protein
MRCLAASTLKRRLLQFSRVPIRMRSLRTPRRATPLPCARLGPLLLPTVSCGEGCAVSILCFVRAHRLRPLVGTTRRRRPMRRTLLKSPLVQPRVTPRTAHCAQRVTLGCDPHPPMDESVASGNPLLSPSDSARFPLVRPPIRLAQPGTLDKHMREICQCPRQV